MEQIGSACVQSAVGVSSFVSPWVVFSDVVPVSVTTTSELFLLYNVDGFSTPQVFIGAGSTVSLWVSRKIPSISFEEFNFAALEFRSVI